MQSDRIQGYGPVLLRFGMSLVFLWFGLSQILDPSFFLGYAPAWLIQLPIDPLMMIKMNGMMEILMGSFLLIGFMTRITAMLLSLHLMAITMGLGYNDIAIRDFGLTVATMAVALHGRDQWSLDAKLESWSLIREARKAHQF